MNKQRIKKMIRKKTLYLMLLSLCFLSSNVFAMSDKPEASAPPEYRNQTVQLQVSDQYEMFQAVLSRYDVGDLQNFHSQHTLPILVEDAFKEIFGNVEKYERGPSIDFGGEEVGPPLFEVKMLDLANDVYNEADNYRAQATLAVALKSPRGVIFWQKAFRANGYTRVDPQYSLGLGPQDAVVDAVRDAIDQMKQAIITSPQVRNYILNYAESDKARKSLESGI